MLIDSVLVSQASRESVEDVKILLQSLQLPLDGVEDQFENFLSSNGYNVSTSNTASKALELVKEKKYDVAVLDFILPDIRGDKLALEIKKIQKDIEIIFVTGFSQFESCIKALKIGISEILLKPITADELVSAVSRSINNGYIEDIDSSVEKIVEES